MTETSSSDRVHGETALRRAVARQMAASKREIPHFYASTDVCMDAASEALRAPQEVHVSVTALLACAVAQTLGEHPRLNGVRAEQDLLEAEAVNLGIAIATDEGILAPAILGCQALSLADTGSALDDLVERARAGKVRAAEASDATFTLSNLGMFGVTTFSAIITPPQVAALAAGAIVPRLMMVDGNVRESKVMTITLSADHRVVDGVDAAAFLASVRHFLENPRHLVGT